MKLNERKREMTSFLLWLEGFGRLHAEHICQLNMRRKLLMDCLNKEEALKMFEDKNSTSSGLVQNNFNDFRKPVMSLSIQNLDRIRFNWKVISTCRMSITMYIEDN